MNVLVIAQHNNVLLDSSTLSLIGAAKQLAKSIDVIVLGYQSSKVIEQLQKIAEISQILSYDDENLKLPTAECITAILKNIAKNYQYILAPANTFGKNFLPRLAAFLDVEQISDVVAIKNNNTFQRLMYAGNVLTTLEDSSPIKVMTIRPTSFAQVTIGNSKVAVTKIANIKLPQCSIVKKLHMTKSKRPDLTNAKIVISGGRGLQSKQNFKLIEKLADYFGGAVGASRAAVDAGFISNDHQIGQTGKVVAPELYFAIGISGAIQHLAGMKDSKIIVAINKDPEAPIFQIADYGMVADLFKVIPEILTDK